MEKINEKNTRKYAFYLVIAILIVCTIGFVHLIKFFHDDVFIIFLLAMAFFKFIYKDVNYLMDAIVSSFFKEKSK